MDFLSYAREMSEHQACPTAPGGCQPCRAGVCVPPAPQPFAWQNGNQLLLLDMDGPHWLVAELAFLPEECRYVEIRCASYDWPREAIGALLARALASGDDALITTVEQLHAYMDRHYGVPLMDC